MEIDAEKSEPKYRQLKQIILRYFEQEHYQADQQIPTEIEFAERFQVSRGTVRQTLTELVNEGVIYKKHGVGSFFAGKQAREARARSGLIGAITPAMFRYIFPHVLRGINDVIYQKGYNLVISDLGDGFDDEYPHLERMLTHGIDGLIFEPNSSGRTKRFQDTRTFALLKSLTIPVVFMGWTFENAGVSCVSLDDMEGGFRATTHLIENGHRRIACLYMSDHEPALLRYQGYRKALEIHNIPVDSRLEKSRPTATWTHANSAYTLTQDLLALGEERPTAIFFFNDRAAIQGYAAIREAGLRIPDDVSVIGFDDSDFAAQIDVPLTSVIHPKYQLGKWAAEMLLEQLDAPCRCTPRQMILHPSIAVRDSVKTLRERISSEI
ncbi:transcriptional repressor [Candidatus Moduliflexus flocculans]|uniref:Transcriptional repressor n=1 Tax=Candidatus Moduliflexus flocculans TaxID=1499966 RepID=A0A0S6VQP8_9BACT|nr:transcriptional repressor [Candidatus Moduliflexus flocculans]